jgi:DNA-binding transcriptional ArsR family regulator
MKRRKGRGKAMNGSKEKKHVRGREMTPALISALDHPIRREILRLLSRDTQISPVQMKESMNVGLSALSYHARTLFEQEVIRLSSTRQVRGSTQHFYASDVGKNKLVAAILGYTEKDDGFLREKPKPKEKGSFS